MPSKSIEMECRTSNRTTDELGNQGGSDPTLKGNEPRIPTLPSCESLAFSEPSEIDVNETPEDIILHTAFSSISVLKTEEDIWKEQEEWGSLNRRRGRLRRAQERSRSNIPVTNELGADPTVKSSVGPTVSKKGERRTAFVKHHQPKK